MLKNKKNNKPTPTSKSVVTTTTPINSMIFTDRFGRDWDCMLTLAGAERVDKSDFTAIEVEEFSILQPDKNLLYMLLTNKRLMFAVIWAIVQTQAKKHSNFEADPLEDPEAAQVEFMEGMGRLQVDEATDALTAALGDFFPEIRNVLLALISKMRTAQVRLSKEMEGLLPRLDKALNEDLDRMVGKAKRQMESDLDRVREEEPGTISGT